MTHLRPLFPTAWGHRAGGQASFPWWADALFAVVALMVLITLVWLTVEIVRWAMARGRRDEHPVTSAPPQP